MKDIFLVDADDTILDFQGASLAGLQEASTACGIEWCAENEKIFHTVNDALWEALERRELTREELLQRRFPLYFSALGVEADANKFNEIYIHALATSPVYVEGAERLLKTLRSYGKIYIVTNGTAKVQRSRFVIAKLNERVDGVFISQDVGYDKPAVEYTNYVISRIEGFEKERALWIGDSLTSDIRPAKEAGITSVWFNPKNKPQNGKATPDYTVLSLDEIAELLKIFSKE